MPPESAFSKDCVFSAEEIHVEGSFIGFTETAWQDHFHHEALKCWRQHFKCLLSELLTRTFLQRCLILPITANTLSTWKEIVLFFAFWLWRRIKHGGVWASTLFMYKEVLRGMSQFVCEKASFDVYKKIYPRLGVIGSFVNVSSFGNQTRIEKCKEHLSPYHRPGVFCVISSSRSKHLFFV